MDGLISSGPSTVQSSLIMGILASIAVLLRLLAKTETKVGFAADDYWIAVSLAIYWAYAGVMVWSIFAGGGGLDMHNFIQGNYPGIRLYLQSLTINSCLFVTSTTTIKMSILILYHRIFSAQASCRRCTIILGVILICWWIAVELGITLYCIPLKKFWSPLEQGYCMNFGIFFLVTGIVDLLLDVSILCLPLWVVSTLPLHGKDRASLTVVFLFGGFVCITAIIRIIKVYVPGSSQVSFTKGLVWSNTHLGTAIICACLLTFRPLVIRWSLSISTLRHRYGLLSNSRGWSIGFSWTERAREANSTDRSYPIPHSDQINLVEAVIAAKAEDGYTHNEHPPSSITIQSSTDNV